MTLFVEKKDNKILLIAGECHGQKLVNTFSCVGTSSLLSIYFDRLKWSDKHVFDTPVFIEERHQADFLQFLSIFAALPD